VIVLATGFRKLESGCLHVVHQLFDYI
jgi:hypothetical protein